MSSIGSAVHNTLLSIAADTGIIGLILFLLILGTVVHQAVSLPKGTAGLWLAIFLTWLIGVLSLSWDVKKLTWIILSLVIIESSFGAQLNAQESSSPFPETIQPFFRTDDSASKRRVLS